MLKKYKSRQAVPIEYRSARLYKIPDGKPILNEKYKI
jgi:hypothetical protein